MKELNENIFEEEVKKSSIPVVVDFWAPWCGPCKMLTPVMEELGRKYDGKVKVVKVNVDENQGLAREYGVASIPTLIVFKEGNSIETSVGFKPQVAIEQMIEKYL
ncbi:thioredoxin [Clostridiaceae bacterium 14S0207]|nr:thioredoxin [Clostridiaceae bacterium 14S0207]